MWSGPKTQILAPTLTLPGTGSNTEVLIPFAGRCLYRERALAWVEGRYADHGLPVRVIEGDGEPWCKGEVVARGLAASTADVIVLADADVWTDGIFTAIDAVRDNGWPWAIPHSLVHRLNKTGTKAVLSGESWERQELCQRPYMGVAGGGMVVAWRDLLLKVGIDRRFTGWGQEDESHALALATLVGDPWRGTADMIHLWHPPQTRSDRRKGSDANWALMKRYRKAHRNPTLMFKLTKEAAECSRTF